MLVSHPAPARQTSVTDAAHVSRSRSAPRTDLERAGNDHHHGQRFLAYLPVGDPNHPIARRNMRGVPPSVSLERAAVAMKRVAVNLYDQLAVGPEEIRWPASDPNLGLG